MATKEKWIQSAKLKEGTLSRQLDIPIEDNIPVTLLKTIRDTEIGETIKNPTKTGKRQFKVTRLLNRRAVLALTLKGFKRMSYKTGGDINGKGKKMERNIQTRRW